MEFLIAAGLGAAAVIAVVAYYVLHRKLKGVANDLNNAQETINKIENKVTAIHINTTPAPVTNASPA